MPRYRSLTAASSRSSSASKKRSLVQRSKNNYDLKILLAAAGRSDASSLSRR